MIILFVFETVSLFRPDWLIPHYVEQVNLELIRGGTQL